LLDSEILAEVYLELVGGRQPDFGLATSAGPTTGDTTRASGDVWRPKPRPAPLAPRIHPEEAEAHAAFIAKLGDGAIWKKRA